MTPDLIRPVRPDEHPCVLEIINDAAQEHIPDDRWHQPYMSGAQSRASSPPASSSKA